MSPPLFLLSIFSVLTVWGIGSLGLPLSLWTFLVVPLFSIYFLCDQSKLWEAAARVSGSPMEIVGVAVVAIFFLYSTLWRPFLLLVNLLCLVKTFDVEKMTYMGDTYGELVKSLVWKVAGMFTGEAERMRYRGDWAYCNPYSRKLLQKEIDSYYTLQWKPASAEDEIDPENYKLEFQIESCRVLCKYTNADEIPGDSSGEYPAVPSHEGNVSIGHLHSPKGESSTPKTPVSDRVWPEHYTLRACYMSKLEVSLKYKKETLERYTFYNRKAESVAEVKRVLEILKDKGPLIFSNVSRNVGSRNPEASHARCYEFEEIFELVLNENFKLHEVKLPTKLFCSISGTWIILLQVLLVVSMTWMNYYQLTQHKPKISIIVSVLTLNIVIQLLLILRKLRHNVRRFFHLVITLIVPKSKIEILYRGFQVHVPWLTFGNESYGYTYTSSRQAICMLGGTDVEPPRLPVVDTRPEGYLHWEQVTDGSRSFDLRALQLQLIVSHEHGDIFVDINMRRRYDNVCCYKNVFTTDDKRVANLIALMDWLEENECMGVCKKWDKMEFMQVYTYEELFLKILQGGARPLILTLASPILINVE